ncbi:hypothetical protein LCGC14_1122880 [marine sediment metagenome]|uniref:Inositol 1,3,4-trisphosphate 5/6-kinase ATP-grasp domain-containing protein n=1 Tax=marine sediment metagenome TaxID=412755 RepID=A0A0F9M3G2_9ZZZZ
MKRKIVFSARQDHEVILETMNKLKQVEEINLILHDPTKEFFSLSEMPKSFKEADLIIVKVRNECSIDLLHFAKIHNIPTLHDVNTVLMCKNKIALDYALRKAIKNHSKKLKKFLMPNSWNQSLRDVNKFKEWALPKLPIVIKSHYQHDKYNRFNFLVQKIDDVDIFCEKYKIFLYYDVYIQKFIECDGYERKIYVIGDKVFGIKRENPIYIYLRERPDKINVDLIEREKFEITEKIVNLTQILSKELDLKIFGFDLVQPLDQDELYLIDLNDFPGFRGIPNIENVLKSFIKEYALAL